MTADTTPEPEAAPSPAPFTITCESGGKCRSRFAGHGTCKEAWQDAFDSGWRADLSQVRHCPACVAERQPVVTLWLAGGALGAYLARKVPPPSDLTGAATEVVLPVPAVYTVPPVPPVPPVPAIPVTEAEQQAAKAQRAATGLLTAWSRGLGQPSGVLEPGSPEALAAYREVSSEIQELAERQDPPARDPGLPETTVIPAIPAEGKDA